MPFQMVGVKKGMTQIFNDAGEVIPVTVIETGPCVITQVKTVEKEGYGAIQLAFGEKREKVTTKPLKGHFGKAGTTPKRWIRETRVDDASKYTLGQEIKCDVFAEGDIIDVAGTTKGRGFTGPVKRWNFGGGRMTHGSKFHRELGSIGQAAYPSKIFKGKKMAGHYGHERVTIENLKIAKVMPEENVILVRGAIPGPNGSMVLVRRAIKKKNKRK